MPPYTYYQELLAKEPLPAAWIDLDALDRNIEILLKPLSGRKMTLRIASKSLRHPWLLRYILAKGKDRVCGVMTMSVAESEFLALHGLDDFLVAYPTTQAFELQMLQKMTSEGKRIVMVVDSTAHLDALSCVAQMSNIDLKVLIDVDMSWRPFWGSVHIGVRRSPIHTLKDVVTLCRYAQTRKGINIAGIMAYEAQIAGLSDQNPFSPFLNPIKRFIRRRSRPYVEKLRCDIVKGMESLGISCHIVNGGGTGSIVWASQESVLTEVTAGSGFLCSHLFDGYTGLDLTPAAFFALPVARIPKPHMVTCTGGGYIASGEAGKDRLPLPFSPFGACLTTMEGAGEVQTPVLLPKGLTLHPGDPVIFRHAKAGELAERFNEYLLVRDGKIVGREPTYRGLGKVFI